MKEKPISKYKIPLAMSLFAAIVILLGLHTIGVFDKRGVLQVNNRNYATGGYIYSGGLENGLFRGYGEMHFHNGDSYVGNFNNGRFEGEGIYIHTGDTEMNDTVDDGWFFDGMFENGLAINGIFYLDDGTEILYERNDSDSSLIAQTWSFIGYINDRGQSGTGTFTYADGSIYTGGFLSGLADGDGSYTDGMGNTIYTGEFRNGLYDGQGIYYSNNDWVYEGNFKEGLFDGEGTVIQDNFVIRGIWERGIQITRYE